IPRARAGELSHRSIARVDARPRPARLRVLRPQHSRRERRRLHHLPRTSGSHAADVAREVASDGMVHRLPPSARALRAAARSGGPRRRRTAGGSVRAGQAARRRISNSEAHELLHMSSMKPDGAPRQAEVATAATRREGWWRTLEERAGDPAFQERLYN